MKVDILAVGVHPDDVELSAAGTLLVQAALGYTFALLDLTKGELGSRGSAALRTQEAQQSAKVLGATDRMQLDLADGFFEHNEANLRPIIAAIRHYRPEIVLLNAISDRHPDHGRSAKLAADACFLSGLVRIQTEFNGQVQDCWRPKAAYHYIQDVFRKPDFVMDISAVFDKKMEAIACFSSQFYQTGSVEPQTPISSPEFLAAVKGKNAVFGRDIGVAFAEGFEVARTPGVSNLFHLV